MLKRFFFFILTNALVIATISIVMSVLGVGHYLTASGINYQALLVFCLLWGMVGSLISLLLSKWMVKLTMGVQTINPDSASGSEGELVQMVKGLSMRAGIPMPEVGIYQSPEPNAFATGPSKNHSLVAVSTGLLDSMSLREVEGVIGHEITHISNGDMVTMTLVQGVVNAFSMFLSRIFSYFISKMVDEKLEYIVRTLLTVLFDILFSILGSIVVCYFSRVREYKADLGSAKISGKQNMIAALRSLQRSFGQVEDNRGESVASLKISGHKKMLSLFFNTSGIRRPYCCS